MQYHPGAKRAIGTWEVVPTLRMEYIGRLGTERGGQRGVSEGDTHGVCTAADGEAPNDTTTAVDE